MRASAHRSPQDAARCAARSLRSAAQAAFGAISRKGGRRRRADGRLRRGRCAEGLDRFLRQATLFADVDNSMTVVPRKVRPVLVVIPFDDEDGRGTDRQPTVLTAGRHVLPQRVAQLWRWPSGCAPASSASTAPAGYARHNRSAATRQRDLTPENGIAGFDQ